MPPVFPSWSGRPSAVLFVVFWCLIAWVTPAHAWNPAGHMTAASFAYDQLSPASRTRTLAILESHPAYSKWQETAPKDMPGFDFGRYAFMHASTWPDEIRKSGNQYDHPVWHYVDFPLVPPDFPMEEPPANAEDILTASAACEKQLTDPATTPVDRAAALSWLIHLIADMMQPLHSVTMISAAHPKPGGDRGGNLFFVALGTNAINLHAYWDGMGGSMRIGPAKIIERAAKIEKKFPRSTLSELGTAKDMHGWALESRQLALDVVYRRGSLPGSDDPQAIPPPLPTGYAAAARKLAERRLALAGYRLADELTRLKP